MPWVIGTVLALLGVTAALALPCSKVEHDVCVCRYMVQAAAVPQAADARRNSHSSAGTSGQDLDTAAAHFAGACWTDGVPDMFLTCSCGQTAILSAVYHDCHVSWLIASSLFSLCFAANCANTWCSFKGFASTWHAHNACSLPVSQAGT